MDNTATLVLGSTTFDGDFNTAGLFNEPAWVLTEFDENLGTSVLEGSALAACVIFTGSSWVWLTFVDSWWRSNRSSSRSGGTASGSG